MKTKEIEEYVKQWMNGYETTTFIKDEYGRYMYTSGAVSLNIEAFFIDLLEDYIEDNNLTNAKLVESLEYLRSCYDLELLNKAKLVEENEDLRKANEIQKKRLLFISACELPCKDAEYQELQSELSAAKERVKELEKNARQLCTLLAKDQILFFLSQGEKDGIMDILKTLTPKQHG